MVQNQTKQIKIKINKREKFLPRYPTSNYWATSSKQQRRKSQIGVNQNWVQKVRKNRKSNLEVSFGDMSHNV